MWVVLACILLGQLVASSIATAAPQQFCYTLDDNQQIALYVEQGNLNQTRAQQNPPLPSLSAEETGTDIIIKHLQTVLTNLRAVKRAHDQFQALPPDSPIRSLDK